MDPLTLSGIGLRSAESRAGLIRSVGRWFGGGTSAAADSVAGMVESVGKACRWSEQQRVLEQKMAMLPPEQQIQLETLKIQLQQLEVERQKLVLADQQAAHHEQQETIRNGDNATDSYGARRARCWPAFPVTAVWPMCCCSPAARLPEPLPVPEVSRCICRHRTGISR